MNYHVLAGTEDGNAFVVVHHIPVPVGNNRVGQSHRIVLVNSGIGGRTILPEGNGLGQITTAERNQVLAGELYEHVEEFPTNPGETAGQLQARIDARFNVLKVSKLVELANRLAYFGFTRNVP